MKVALRIVGALALFSALLWAFAGIPLWAGVDGNSGRAMFLFVFHFAAILGGALSFAD